MQIPLPDLETYYISQVHNEILNSEPKVNYAENHQQTSCKLTKQKTQMLVPEWAPNFTATKQTTI